MFLEHLKFVHGIGKGVRLLYSRLAVLHNPHGQNSISDRSDEGANLDTSSPERETLDLETWVYRGCLLISFLKRWEICLGSEDFPRAAEPLQL